MSITLSAPLLEPRTDTWCAACPSGNCHFAGTFHCITLMRGTLHYLYCVLFLDVLAIDQSCIILYTLSTVMGPVSQTEYSRETLLKLKTNFLCFGTIGYRLLERWTELQTHLPRY
jgi:hypothetical protein